MYANRKAAQAAQMRTTLEQVARELFETHGFAAVSAEELVARAGVTRGALYHHYDGKQGLFEAVAEAAMQRLHDQVAHAAALAPDPLAAVRLGMHRFLELGSAPRTQRVLFVDAPVVMGWHRWRQLDERYGLGLLKQGLDAAIAQRQMRAQNAALAAQLLLSAMIEAAMMVARSTRKTEMRAESERALDRVLQGLAS